MPNQNENETVTNLKNGTLNPLDVFNDPFTHGLINEDAIDNILKDKKLMEALSKIKF